MLIFEIIKPIFLSLIQEKSIMQQICSQAFMVLFLHVAIPETYK